MSVREKLDEIDRRIRERKEEHIDAASIVIILAVAIFLSGFFINSILNQQSVSQPLTTQPLTTEPVNSTSGFKAAIVDQESLTFPNQTFIQTATSILTQAGYSVDYYSGDQVTVEFYRTLPTHGYNLIILRTHSTAGPAFFTSELYNSSYFTLKLFSMISAVSYYVGGPVYFAIPPSFVTSYMGGRFNGSIIIAMGCFSMQSNAMAKAFIEQGAKAYVGWSSSVEASHTDSATTSLLRHLLIENRTITEATGLAMQDVGADPVYKSVLLSLSTEQTTTGSEQNKENGNADYRNRGGHPDPH